jgi:hypothetical protein
MSTSITMLAARIDDPDVRVTLPYATTSSDGPPLLIPWYLHLDDAISIRGPRDAMVAIRDALTTALDAHPDDSPAGES